MYISYHFFLFLVISFPLSWKFEEKKKDNILLLSNELPAVPFFHLNIVLNAGF